MKKLLTLLLASALTLSLAGCTTNPDSNVTSDLTQKSLEQIIADGEIVMATEAQYAPFEYKNADADIVGCDIWLAEQIAEELEVSLRVIDMSFDGIIPSLASGSVDFAIAAITATPERDKRVDFSIPYQRDMQALVVKAENAETYTTTESLVGLKVGAQKGSMQSMIITDSMPESDLFELAKYPALGLEVLNGNIAGIVVDGAVAEGMVAADSNLAMANYTFGEEASKYGKAVAVSQGDLGLRDVIDTVITRVTENGSFDIAYNEAIADAKTLGL